MRTIGLRDGVNGFTVGIENPDENDKSTYAEYLELKGEALVTSGSYQRYYYVRGKRYRHADARKQFFVSLRFDIRFGSRRRSVDGAFLHGA